MQIPDKCRTPVRLRACQTRVLRSGMAKKQSRRGVSLNRINYESAKQEADRRGVTLAALVEMGLAAIGVPMVAHPQQTAELVRANAARRAESLAARASQPRSTRGRRGAARGGRETQTSGAC